RKLLLPNFITPGNYTSPLVYLTTLCNQGLKAKYGRTLTTQHKDRLNYELKIIDQMGFSSYFLIVSDFIQYAKKNQIPVGPGRGSGAGSIVAYSLNITNVCPLKYNLLFERFLNPNRHSMPDLDIDFGDLGRERVIQYVRNKYGEDKCAQIITFGSMQSKLVIKDVCRVMGFSTTECNNISKLIPYNMSISESLKNSQELSTLMKSDKKINDLVLFSKQLEGIKRHIGVHAAGIIISDKPIVNYSPLSKNSKQIITTQYDGETLTRLGLLKIDFLGLRTLTIIDDTIKCINKKIDLNNIPLNDRETYKLLEKSMTMGIFQLESDGIRNLLRKLKPNCIEDIIALIALYRPGPMSSKMLDEFINRKNGITRVTYDHELEENILNDTYGVILYQEQVMKIAEILAGFTPWEADNLRSAMSKKIIDNIEQQKQKFIDGAQKKGIKQNISNKIFNNILAFAGYGFNKSHAAAYSIISYQTAFLKAHYPLQYFTALLNSEIGRYSTINDKNKQNKIELYLQDARNFNIKILPPDVQYSNGKFTIENMTSIRFGLLAIKNVGESFTKSIEQYRCDNKRFKSWNEFLQKIDLKSTNKKAIENLIKSGACDSFGTNRFQTRINLLHSLKENITNAIKVKNESESAQMLLFSNASIIKEKNKENSLFDEYILINFEKDVLGFYLSGNPLQHVQDELISYSDYKLDNLPKINKNITVSGMITYIYKFISQYNIKNLMAKFTIEDLYGKINVLVFLEIFSKVVDDIILNNIILIQGHYYFTVRNNRYIVANNIVSLSKVRADLSILCDINFGIHIKLTNVHYNSIIINKLKLLLEKQTSGNMKVYLDILDKSYRTFIINTNYNITFSKNFIQDVSMLLKSDNAIEYKKKYD
ncbi:MAG: DNA polymerase III subunit alpha, partial [Endomicrobium sp.]|nr:DNA polymerase III subunit alpha [Endomicrobium sp.]